MKKMTSQEWLEKKEVSELVFKIVAKQEAPDNVRGECEDLLTLCRHCGHYHALSCIGAKE